MSDELKRVLERLEELLPAPPKPTDWQASVAFRWRTDARGRGAIQPVRHVHRLRLSDLRGIDAQIAKVEQNTKQFLDGKPANNVLLTGARGTGKSSIVKGLLNKYSGKGLRLIEVEKNDLVDLPAIVDRDEVVVAVSTAGASPTLAAMVRARIEAALPERIGALARLAAAFRAQVSALLIDPGRRRAFFRRLVDGPAARLALSGDEADARRRALGELDMARRRLKGDEDPRVRAYLDNAGEGARRAALLTGRLLAFARRQQLQPEAVDPNVLVAGLTDLFRRTLGERREQVFTVGFRPALGRLFEQQPVAIDPIPVANKI